MQCFFAKLFFSEGQSKHLNNFYSKFLSLSLTFSYFSHFINICSLNYCTCIISLLCAKHCKFMATLKGMYEPQKRWCSLIVLKNRKLMYMKLKNEKNVYEAVARQTLSWHYDRIESVDSDLVIFKWRFLGSF